MDETNRNSLIIPFCIYHIDNQSDNTFLGQIEKSNNTKWKQKFGWSLYYKFYAVVPTFRPIPSGLKLLSTTKADNPPYNTTKIEVVYDPYNKQYINNKNVNFMTWTSPVPYTTPLYIHVNNKSIYPSFNKNPPSNIGWVQASISPIYVLTENSPLTFRGLNGRCLPDFNGTSLDECFLITNENILGTNPIPSSELALYINNLNNLISSSSNQPFNYFLIMIFLILVLFMIFLIYSYLK